MPFDQLLDYALCGLLRFASLFFIHSQWSSDVTHPLSCLPNQWWYLLPRIVLLSGVWRVTQTEDSRKLHLAICQWCNCLKWLWGAHIGQAIGKQRHLFVSTTPKTWWCSTESLVGGWCQPRSGRKIDLGLISDHRRSPQATVAQVQPWKIESLLPVEHSCSNHFD